MWRSRRNVGHRLWPLLLLALCLLFMPDRVGAIQASGEHQVAGIVVDYGDGRVSYALVPFDDEGISGMDLLHRSGLALLTVDFGGIGEGVCQIEETGCEPGPCRARLCQTGDPDSAFWQYLEGDDGGNWAFAALGASASTVDDGDVDGWYWTGTTPTGAALTLDAIAGQLDVDLSTLRAGDSLDPVAATVGAPNATNETSRRDVLAGVAIVLVIAGAGVVAVRRSRRGAPAT
jgi:hypothetical protein